MEAESQAGMSTSGTMAFLGIGEDKDNYLSGAEYELRRSESLSQKVR